MLERDPARIFTPSGLMMAGDWLAAEPGPFAHAESRPNPEQAMTMVFVTWS
jgi:hypothetical protein